MSNAAESALPSPDRRAGADRPQTLGEEVANALSHGLGLLLAVAALPLLVVFAEPGAGAARIVGVSLFAATGMLLYATSALYHALPAGRAKRLFNRLDHAAIFVFIAGSYMPFTLGVLRGGWGWALFGVVWALAALGVAAKLANRLRHPLASTALYVAMGWVVLVAAVPLVERLSATGLAWLLAGGIAYTAGAVVYCYDNRLRYGHFAWHLLVVAGSTCHFFAALWQGPAAG